MRAGLAAILTRSPYGFSSIKLPAATPAGVRFGPPGYECDLLCPASLAALVLMGPTPLSLDRRFHARRDEQARRTP
ncbi:MAG TPA: hypothetical protein VHX37_06195 [Acidobacteriaceae bacterium]|nr:hypothetical protein [Acidobacteriaceae bacterium]